jgi:xanthine dehydrogenase accessory factor
VQTLAGAAGYDAVDGAVASTEGAAAVIVASHGAAEEDVLAGALRGGVPYVALVASRARGTAVRASLDVAEELRGALHTPAGLDIGARTPTEIAIAILAELVAEQHATPSTAAPHATAVDPVCGMTVATEGSALHLDRPEGRVFFCSEHCRDTYADQHAVAR